MPQWGIRMKWLLTFAVVNSALGQRVCRRLRREPCGPSLEPRAPLIESVLVRALKDSPNSVIFYRCIMDGWDATHCALQGWIKEHRPRAAQDWRRYVRSGVLVGLPGEDVGQAFLPRPSHTVILRAFPRKRPESYAVHAVVSALYDALEFYTSTSGTLLMTASCIGMTMDDSEYT
jgi:hypothetical protein